MSNRAAAVLATAFRTGGGDLARASDRDLLARYAEAGDQAAFAALVDRHGAMVLAVCRRALGSAADAEDACQAVFLVLARKAGGGRWRASVANWLYLAARKVSRDVRRAAGRRGRRERAVAVPEAVPFDAMSGRELVAALDEELARLPARHREPLVLCYLEGLSRDEAAARLSVPEATLKSQLERGRKRLADALAARGCELGVTLLATATATAAGAFPPRLTATVLAGVGGSPSAAAAALAKGFAMNGVLTRSKVLAVGLVGLLAAGVASLPLAAQPPKPADKVEPPAVKAEVKGEPKPGVAKPRSITGVVLGPDGQPVEGAEITTHKESQIADFSAGSVGTPKWVPLAKTDAKGQFRVALPALPDGQPEYRFLVADKAKFVLDWVSVGDVRDAPVTLRLSANDVPIKGRVTDLQGKPVANAKVRLTSVTAGDLSRVWEQWPRDPYVALQQPKKQMTAPTQLGLPESVTADADGKFEINGVGRGWMLGLAFEAGGLERAACRVVADPEFDPKKVEQPKPATPSPASARPGPELYGSTFTHAAKPSQPVVGTITDAKTGKPLPGVIVSGAADGPHWWENNVTTTTDKDGRFTLRGIAKADHVRLHVSPAATHPHLPLSTTVAGRPGLTEVTADLKLSSGVRVKGRVVEKGTGKPVAGAAVRYSALAGNAFAGDLTGGQAEQVWAPNTGADGRFELIARPGAGLLLAQGETRNTPAPIPYTQVRVAKADLPRAETQYRDTLGDVFAAADGRLLPLHGQSGYTIIDPKPADETAEATIEFDRGTSVSGTVVDADGKPAAGVTAYLLAACYDRPQPLKDGAFTAVALEADHPRTVLFVDEAKKLAASVDLKGDEKQETVKLRPWGSLAGRLLDPDGKPMAGVTVQATAKAAIRHMAFNSVTRSHTATTDADGRYTLAVPGGPAEYLPLFTRKGRFLNTGLRQQTPGHVVKPGETTDLGDHKVTGD